MSYSFFLQVPLRNKDYQDFRLSNKERRKMNEKDFKMHMDLLKKRQERNITKEEAMHTFVMAGIFNWDGTYTDNYPCLQAWQAERKRNKKCTASDQT